MKRVASPYFINGTNEVDLLKGYKGNDTLSGGDGNDIYFFRAGDGNDTITDTGGRIIFQGGVYGIGADITVAIADRRYPRSYFALRDCAVMHQNSLH